MDGAANGYPAQGADPAAAGVNPNAAAPAGDGWRANLLPEGRAKIVNKIVGILEKHLPVTAPEGLSELRKIAVRYEERMYAICTSQTDYLRKISLKMLSMESQAKANPHGPDMAVIYQPPAILLVSQPQSWQPNASTFVRGSLLLLPVLIRSSELAGCWVPARHPRCRMSGMPQDTMANGLAQGSTSKGEKGNKLRCHFCKRGGHFKKDCRRREIWFKKKGIAYDPTH